MKGVLVIAVLNLMLTTGAFAHEPPGSGAKAKNQPISTEEYAFGREGDPKKITRTIRIRMSDQMRFTPAAIQVQQGETVRFEVKNSGHVMHEMVLGNMEDLKQHDELMKKYPNMQHDEPYMAHVAPGKSVRMIWQFPKAGTFYFGCLEPGHFEAGMIGRITVRSKSNRETPKGKMQ